jgi:putative cardiolipin synthase
MPRRLPACLAPLALLALAACTGVPVVHHKPVSVAVPPAAVTPEDRYVQAEAAARPADHSGFRLLTLGTNALMSRVALADQAARSIDVQTFIFANDATGRLFADRLLGAADRGVRVRLLLDVGFAPDDASLFDALDAHPGIEVRLFNPFASRDPGKLARWTQLLLEFRRLNRRMHNKSLIVDNTVAIVGGRNIGDEYFDASADDNYRDLDLLAIGPVVGEASRSFDTYWNDEAALPNAAWGGADDAAVALAALRPKLKRDARRFAESDYAQAVLAELPHGATEVRPGEWFWGRATLVADPPEAIEAGRDATSLRIGAQVAQVFAAAQSELLLLTPYFVPSRAELARFAALERQGVAVRVLTNSLASTNHAVVHSGYAQRRRDLLASGVDLFEYKPRPAQDGARHRAGSGGATTMHAKSFVVDRRYTFVGSLNIDPRSRLLNTEMGFLVDSPPLAEAVARYFATATAPANAYRVAFADGRDGGALRWHTEDNGAAVVLTREPDAGFGRRLKVLIGKLLPIDGLL